MPSKLFDQILDASFDESYPLQIKQGKGGPLLKPNPVPEPFATQKRKTGRNVQIDHTGRKFSFSFPAGYWSAFHQNLEPAARKILDNICQAKSEKYPVGGYTPEDSEYWVIEAEHGFNDPKTIVQKFQQLVADGQLVFTEKDGSCPFCDPDRKIVLEKKFAFAVFDQFPVSEGHCLILPKRHVSEIVSLKPFVRGITSLNEFEYQDCFNLIREMIKRLEGSGTIAGFNIGANLGHAAGQTIDHLHFHVIPRTLGDVEDPAGGIRAVIPEKKTY